MDRRFMLKAASLVILGKLVKVPSIVIPTPEEMEVWTHKNMYEKKHKPYTTYEHKEFNIGFIVSKRMVQDDIFIDYIRRVNLK